MADVHWVLLNVFRALIERVDFLRSKLAVGRLSFAIWFRLAGPGISEGPWVMLDFVKVQIRVVDTREEWSDLEACL